MCLVSFGILFAGVNILVLRPSSRNFNVYIYNSIRYLILNVRKLNRAKLILTIQYLFLNWGHWSTIAVLMASMPANWLPKPKMNSMKKNSIDQSWGIGIWSNASGYATKANPAPCSATSGKYPYMNLFLFYLLGCTMVAHRRSVYL